MNLSLTKYQIKNATYRSFDPSVITILGKYVYALRDPRDRKLFYVGQGTGNRVFDHFNEAEDVLSGKKSRVYDSKVFRIIDIWNSDWDVEWMILAYKLGESNISIADIVESSVYASLSESQNGPPLNNISTPNSLFLTRIDILSLSAKPISPSSSYEKVFIFPIYKALELGKTVYDATRSAWPVSELLMKNPMGIALGVSGSIVQGGFEITSWNPFNSSRYEFSGIQYSCFNNTRVDNIISHARGYFQYGNYLVVEFDGKGKFRFIKGNIDKVSWFNL